MQRLLRTLFTVRGLIVAGTLALAVAGSCLDQGFGVWLQPAGHWLVSTLETALLLLGGVAFLLLIGTLALAAGASDFLKCRYDPPAWAGETIPDAAPFSSAQRTTPFPALVLDTCLEPIPGGPTAHQEQIWSGGTWSGQLPSVQGIYR
jgi:hypothetical protein